MVLVMRNVLIGGRAAGLRTSLGILCGNLVHISYCVVGIGWLVSQSILLFNLLKFAGPAYLVYLGLCSLRAGTFRLDVEAAPATRPVAAWFVQGLVNNILNPKGTLFYLGVFTTVITPATSKGAMVVLVAAMMAISASVWLLFVHTLDRPAIRGWIGRSQRLVNRLFGGLLILLGVRVALVER